MMQNHEISMEKRMALEVEVTKLVQTFEKETGEFIDIVSSFRDENDVFGINLMVSIGGRCRRIYPSHIAKLVSSK